MYILRLSSPSVFSLQIVEQILAAQCLASLYPLRVPLLFGKYKDLTIDKYNHQDVDFEDMEAHSGHIEFTSYKGFSLQLFQELAPSSYYNVNYGFLSLGFISAKGVNLNITIGLKEHSKTSIHLEFSETLIRNGQIDYEKLKALGLELRDIINAQHFDLINTSVFDKFGNPSYWKYHSRIRYPICLCWMSYFRHDLVEFIGEERFVNLQGLAEKENLPHGYFVSTTLEAFDIENEEHIQNAKQLLNQLGLDRFVFNS